LKVIEETNRVYLNIYLPFYIYFNLHQFYHLLKLIFHTLL
jgi:hypothetical protein